MKMEIIRNYMKNQKILYQFMLQKKEYFLIFPQGGRNNYSNLQFIFPQVGPAPVFNGTIK